MRARRALLVVAALLAACSSDKPKPTPLEPLTPQLQVAQAWRAKVDKVSFPLVPAVAGGVVTLASDNGTVTALQADSGREVWRASIGAPIGAGVGSDGRRTAVVTRDNELLLLEDGAVKWRARLNSRIASAPLVAGERVFVMGVDRVVHAFDAIDGRKLWMLQRPGEPLTLSQASVVAPFKNTLLVAQGPRLAGIDPLQGTVRWEVPLASPRGTNEVERLADLVGPPLRNGNVVCARAFQSAVGCADADRGTLVWSKNVGGVQAVGGDAEYVFGADASDRITAWRAASGEVAWTSEKLLHRGLSAPTVFGNSVVFGDDEGYVHFLARATGDALARVATDGSPVVGRPVVAQSTLVVVTRDGGVFGLR